MLFRSNDTATTEISTSSYTLSLHDALPILRIDVASLSEVAVTWPAHASSWALDCRMDYVFSGGGAIDMTFEATPRKREWPRGYIAFMWASYLQKALDRRIHFQGPGGWSAFGEEKEGGGIETGTVAFQGQPPTPQDDESAYFNLATSPEKRFSAPFYYGLVDGDGFPETRDDVMALIMMFDDAPATRFSLWNWGGDTRCPAWDWQWILRNPQVGRTYRHRSRMVYEPFTSPEAVADRCARGDWETPVPAGRPDADLLARLSPGAGPGNQQDDPVLLSLRLVEEGLPDLALPVLQTALSVPKFEVPAASLMDNIVRRKDPEDGCLAFWTEMLERHPGRAAVQFFHGRACEDKGRLAEAEESYRRSLAATNGNADQAVLKELRPMLARVLGRRGQDLLNTRQWQEAIPLFQEARELDPQERWHEVMLGQARAGQGDYGAALQLYLGVLRDHPEGRATSRLVDEAYRAMNDPAGRVGEWTRMTGAHPDTASCWLHLGMAQRDAGAPEEAETSLRRALDEDRGADPALTADIRAALAETLGALGRKALEEMNPARAEALLREAMRLNPQDRWHEVWLGKALAARGQHGEALETYRGVLRDHPDARETGQLVDETYRAMNDPAGRVAEWTRMTGAHPDSASCWLHLGKALEDAGNASAAAEAFGRARALNPKMEGLPAGDRTGAAP